MDKRWTSGAAARALVTGATGLVGRALLAELGDHAAASNLERLTPPFFDVRIRLVED
jgi:uncharacterized protein YbjT (DUF2867 family)